MKKLSIAERVKIGASLLLVICLLLPISSCTREIDSNGKLTYFSEKPVVSETKEYNYILEDFNKKDPGDWLLLLCFLWPAFILIHRYKSKKTKLKIVIWLLEPVLLCLSSYFILIISNILSAPAIGAILAHIANSFYAIAWITELIHKLKIRPKGTSFFEAQS